MTAPAAAASSPQANWLLRYISVQQTYDPQFKKALQNAMTDATTAAGKFNVEQISGRVKTYQSSLVRNEIRKVIKDLYTKITPIISNGQQDAAEAAAKAELSQSAKVLKALFPDPKDRQSWQDSFTASARHGIAAMATRISVSQLPLSQRVYKTQAYSSGLVDRRVNSALARGASAKELASTVKDLINPDTPGGVSYAAMRLARSEINNAFHAMSIQSAQELPWNQYVEWHLSKSHKPHPGDLCEDYAEQVDFDVNGVPAKPHPQCMCYIVPKQMEWSDFTQQLQAGGFDDFYQQKYGQSSTAA